MGRNSDFGFSDSGSSGGYESVKMDEGAAQAQAKSMMLANEAAANTMAGPSPNAPGGPQSGVAAD